MTVVNNISYQNMKNILYAIVVIAIALLLLSRLDREPPTRPDNNDVTTFPISATGEQVRGASDASVTLVEYADFQCPACASYHDALDETFAEYGDRVKFVFRHFPLKQIHPNAEPAARASLAAGKQGKFWEMHDILFERQRDWSGHINAKKTFHEYASELGIDMTQYALDVDSDEIKDAVNESFNEGFSAGVNSTPTFYLNGEKIKPASSIESFRSFIDPALAAVASDAPEMDDHSMPSEVSETE